MKVVSTRIGANGVICFSCEGPLCKGSIDIVVDLGFFGVVERVGPELRLIGPGDIRYVLEYDTEEEAQKYLAAISAMFARILQEENG